MNKKKEQKLSGFMTKVLRHSPLEYGVYLNADGFTPIEDLLNAIKNQPYWKETSLSDLTNIVETCEKQRYELKGNLIRARYGHSFMKLSYQELQPPDTLLHGTATQFLESILKQGILSMNRQYVHLSETDKFASLTGKRHGELVLLKIDSKKAYEEGVKFYFAGNEVWLSEKIPMQYISLLT
jgi:putative RNA 2'-phosphotransferase